MKQSIIEILKVRVDERGVKNRMVCAMETAIELLNDIERFAEFMGSDELETRRETRETLITKMKKTQAMLWELQLILGIDDLEKQTEDCLEWQELQSIPH